MANFTAADVKRLREITGSGMMACKNALAESEGDFDKAVEILRIQGAKDVGKRAERATAQGLVASKDGVVIELNAETDFVAKNDQFINLADRIVNLAAEKRPADLDELLALDLDGETVADAVQGLSAIIGEKMQLARYGKLDGQVSTYMHKRSADLPPQVGVFVVTDAAGASVAHDIAMHIAAYMPAYLDRDAVPADVLEKERETLTKITLEEGKPEHIVGKIVEGRMEAYFKDNCLVDQAFARDPSKSVGKVLAEAGAKVTEFVRVHVGA